MILDGPIEGEMILAPDGRWLGDFAAEYVAPRKGPWDIRFPVGFTHGTWFEMSGLGTIYDGCECGDCCTDAGQPLIVTVFYLLRTPGEEIDLCSTTGGGREYGVAIMPRIGIEGCHYVLQNVPCLCKQPPPPQSCWPVSPYAGGHQESAEWPLVSFGICNPSASLIRVVDDSGPAGMEGLAAAEIEFSGAGSEGMTFVGEGGGYDDSSVPTDNWLANRRSTTGIEFNHADADLTWSCWAKAVPDRYGNLCSDDDYNLFGGIQLTPVGPTFAFLPINISTPDHLPYYPPEMLHPSGVGVRLSENWRYMTGRMIVREASGLHPPGPYVNPMFFVGTQTPNYVDPLEDCPFDYEGAHNPYPKHASQQPIRGRVRIKALHLAPTVLFPYPPPDPDDPGDGGGDGDGGPPGGGGVPGHQNVHVWRSF